VIERREHLRLALESREPIAIGRHHCRQNFQGDVAAELGVARAVDFAHPAGADWRDDFVRTDPRSGLEGHRRGL
jgi:hypothetical protein